MERVALIVMFCGVAGAFASVAYGLLEKNAQKEFKSWVYRRGIRVSEQSHPSCDLSDLTGVEMLEDQVHAKVVSPSEVLFFAPPTMGAIRLNTATPVLGTLALTENGAKITGRIMVGPVAFAGCMLVALAASVVGAYLEGAGKTGYGVGMSVVFVSVLAMIFGASLATELPRFRRAVACIDETLGKDAAPPLSADNERQT